MSRLVEQARTYIDTPYRHRGRTSRGLDCAGLIWRCYADLGVILPDVRIYGREPHKDGLMDAVRACGQEVPLSDMRAGDVAVLVFTKEPHHLGIIADDVYGGFSLIHADGTLGVSRVVERRLTEDKMKQIVAVFRRAV